MVVRLSAIAVLLAALAAPAPPQPRDDARVLLISIDGLMPSAYTDASGQAPALGALAKEGAWADGVVGVLPTVTYPSHTTLVTGVEPAVHGIYDNRVLDPENKSSGAWYYYASDIRVPTLPAAARARGLRTGAISWPVSVGLDADYLVPEFFRNEHEDNLKMLRALSTPRTILDAVEVARQKPFGWPQTDRERTDIALFMLKTFDPHLLLVHLIDVDSAQHSKAPGSPEARAAIARVDGYVAELVAALKAAGRYQRTTIAVVSDHGFLPVEKQLQPNALFKQEGLIEANASGRITAWQAYFHSSGGSGFVYLKDASLGPRVLALLERLKSDPANGVRAIWTRDELAARGSHPDAEFGLDVVDGFYTSDKLDGLVVPATSRGGHGFDPERRALHASFIIRGPDVQRRGSLGVIRMTQIAPTLASILKTGLSPAAARPLEITKRD